MKDLEPTVRTRELGEGLRQAIETAGLTGQQVAPPTRLAPEPGVQAARRETQCHATAGHGVARGVPGHRRRARPAARAVPEAAHPRLAPAARLPAAQQLVTLINHENKAVTISDFQSMMVPGLLQTGDYARALMQGSRTDPVDEVEDRVAARLARQSLFGRDRPVRFTFFIHEFVLRLPVGGRAVMFEQLHHLLGMSMRPHLTLRVVPAALGAHAGIAGHVKLMEFAEFKPVAYLDSQTSCLFLERPEEIATYRHILATLAETALGEGESRELIATLATELYADREGHNDRA